MTELSPEARALLEQARRTHGPSEQDRERVLSSLHASLGIALPLALLSSVAEAATQTATQVGTQAAGQAAGSGITQGAELVGQSGAQLAQGAVQSAPGVMSYASKLLTWKAGKILLASVALGSAVGISTLPRSKRVEDDAVAVRTSHVIARPAEREQTRGNGGPSDVEATDREPTADVREAVNHAPAERTSDTAAPGLQQAPTVAAAASEPARPAEPAPGVAHAPSTSSAEKLASSGVTRAGSASHRRSTYRTRVHRERVGAASTPAAVDPTPEAALQAEQSAAAGTVTPPAEVELIRKAMTSLRDRDAPGALGLLEEHASRYPNGAFATERSGLHAVALCAAGRVAEGRSEQASFLREHAAAPIAARVRRACLEPKK